MPMYRNDDELAAEFALELQQTMHISHQYAGDISRAAVRFFKQAAPRKTFSQVLREMNDWETDEHGSKKCPACQQTLYWQKLTLKPRYIHALQILDRENIPLTFKQLSQFARSEPKGATYYRYFTELRHWGFVRGTGELLERAEKYEITPDGMRFIRGEIAAWQWVWKLKGKDLAMPQPYADTPPAPMVHAGDVLAGGDTPDEENDRVGHLRSAQSVREGTVEVDRDDHTEAHALGLRDSMRPQPVPIREAGKPVGLRSVPVHADRPCIDQHGPYEQCMRCDPQVQEGVEVLDRIAAAADGRERQKADADTRPVDGVTAMDPGAPGGDSTVVTHHCRACGESWSYGEHQCGPRFHEGSDGARVMQALNETHLCVCSAPATHHYVAESGILMHQCQACFLRDA